MPAVCVCMHVSGRANYFLAARQSLSSVLHHTPFDAVVVTGAGPRWLLPAHPRLRVRTVADATAPAQRATPFLRKFSAIAECLRVSDAPYFMLLDADTVVAQGLDAGLVERTLDGFSLGMAEQTTIRGSTMGRAQFLEHYVRYSQQWIDSRLPAPPLADFRFFNSGVVLGTRSAIAELTEWALRTVAATGPLHQVGQHMVADQDYFQVWTNSLHPGSCKTLGWQWNHCEHWDDGFPQPGAHVWHFSNFCNGPTMGTIARMAWRRRT